MLLSFPRAENLLLMMSLFITRRCFLPPLVPQCHASSYSSHPVAKGIKTTANTSNGCLKSAPASFASSLTFPCLPHLMCLAALHPGFQAQIWKSPVPSKRLLFFWQYLPSALVELSQGLCDACAIIQSVSKHYKQKEVDRFLPQQLGISSARKAARVGVVMLFLTLRLDCFWLQERSSFFQGTIFLKHHCNNRSSTVPGS